MTCISFKSILCEIFGKCFTTKSTLILVVLKCIFVIYYNILYPQVSKLCPGEYPTTIDILITDSTDDTTIQNINDVMLMEGSQDNILTTVDNITLQSDMIYTIQVSFSNLDGEFNITSSTNFSKFSLVMSL